MLGKASVIKIRNQVKNIPVLDERFFPFTPLTLTNDYQPIIFRKHKYKQSGTQDMGRRKSEGGT